MIRTRFAPSPTGFMHIGNLRTALFEYLIAKSNNGKFLLRIEDTDQERFVEGSIDMIYNSLEISGIIYDEGPKVGGDYGPYIQSERKHLYMPYALQLVKEKKAYYCFCSKEDIEIRNSDDKYVKYDRHCFNLLQDDIQKKLDSNSNFVIRQLIPEGSTTFRDEVFGDITVNNIDLEDQVLIKSDGLPTYNFANVIDDYLMKITHVVRGSEYLSSTPKYNLLYEAFKWEIPIYIHLPLIVNSNGDKLSKRKGDATFDDLIKLGYLPEAIVNYIALLGWSLGNGQEIFSLKELEENFSTQGLNKSPSTFDILKLNWVNSEYIKKMNDDEFFDIALPYLNLIKKEDLDLKYISSLLKSRIQIITEIPNHIDFIDELPIYGKELFIHKKMKTTEDSSLNILEEILPIFEKLDVWSQEEIHNCVFNLISNLNVKNGQVLWPIRTALSGKPSSPCGGVEITQILGKDETLRRIIYGIELLKN